MQFGLFGSAQAERGSPDGGRGFFDYVDYCVEAEALGFRSTFLVEHHFSGFGQISAPLQLLTWIAARTTTLRLGTAVLVLPWHDPVLLAEQAATVDLLSGGRLDFGVGKGYRHREFHGFAIPVAEAEARFDEALAVIRQAWMSDAAFSHRGRFWRYQDIVVEPAPVQKPHPPVWMAAGSDASIRRVAALGANMLLDQFGTPELLGQRIQLFAAEVERHGRRFDPLQVAVARNFWVARDAADAADALQKQMVNHERLASLARDPAGTNRAHILSYEGGPTVTVANALIGTPDDIERKLDALHAVGVRYILLNGTGKSVDNLRRFAREVMPRVGQPLPA